MNVDSVGAHKLSSGGRKCINGNMFNSAASRVQCLQIIMLIVSTQLSEMARMHTSGDNGIASFGQHCANCGSHSEPTVISSVACVHMFLVARSEISECGSRSFESCITRCAHRGSSKPALDKRSQYGLDLLSPVLL